MSLDKISYVLSKKYTDDTADEFGGLKGASCQIQSIDYQNGRNTVTFLWVNSAGEERTSQMVVQDGTPIYEWRSGDDYKYGDLVIYASAFYRCITPNHDIEFDATKWNEIGSPDGNYDIVENSDLLPAIFTAADRKMYYSIADEDFWLWNGVKWKRQSTLSQFDEMPVATYAYRNRVVQYIGQTTASYKFGYFYTAILKDDVYEWSAIDGQDTVTVDDEMSLVSENPVQNKVITQALIDKTTFRLSGENLIMGLN